MSAADVVVNAKREKTFPCRKYIFSKKNFVVSFSSIFRRRQQKQKLAQFTFLY